MRKVLSIIGACVILAGCMPKQEYTPSGKPIPSGYSDKTDAVISCITFYSAYAQVTQTTNPALAEQFAQFAVNNYPAAWVAEWNKRPNPERLTQPGRTKEEFSMEMSQANQRLAQRIEQWKQIIPVQPNMVADQNKTCSAESPYIVATTSKMRADPQYNGLFQLINKASQGQIR
jgi:hypothetical protein